MNRKRQLMTCFKSEEYILSGFDLLHHAKFSFVQRPQIKLKYFCIENGNSPLFNDRLLIKCANNAPRKVTKNIQQTEHIHFLWE